MGKDRTKLADNLPTLDAWTVCAALVAYRDGCYFRQMSSGLRMAAEYLRLPCVWGSLWAMFANAVVV